MPSPMPEQDDDREGAVVEAAQGAIMSENQAHLLASAAERWLRPANQLDYMIRRTVIPSAREPLRGVSRSTPRGKASLWNSERLLEVQEAIGRCLRAQYDLAQPIPARLVELLRQLDNVTASPELTTRDGYASRA
jgi:Anti-sigma factor NepR